MVERMDETGVTTRRCAACGGLPFGTCLRSGAASLTLSSFLAAALRQPYHALGEISPSMELAVLEASLGVGRQQVGRQRPGIAASSRPWSLMG
jgi:hypothetical protein